MIKSLSVRNYALIENLQIDFSDGFSTITGETGAGKSILMGALSLILGQRADTAVLKNKSDKCIVEGQFRISENFRELFSENELDFDSDSVFRREISPQGKSRSFINDTPVTLQVMRELGTRLVDIHSQHQNLQLNDQLYQLEVVDFVASNNKLLREYRDIYDEFTTRQRDLRKMREDYLKMKGDLEYMEFQFEELAGARLQGGEMEELEAELNALEHAEEIRNNLEQTLLLLSNEGAGANDLLREVVNLQQKLAGIFHPSVELSKRFESAYIEIKDLINEVERFAETTDLDPERLTMVQERIDLIYRLMQKHRVRSVEELISVKDQLDEKISEITLSDERIGKLEKEILRLEGKMDGIADSLHNKRSKSGQVIQSRIVDQLIQLGIPNARFEVRVEPLAEFDRNGKSRVNFMFSANKQTSLEEISHVASGGEVSRLMLSIKSLISDHKDLPTLIFDEIDAGVSGEIADKVGNIMNRLSAGRQVIAITHLPQVASQGSDHYMVFKEDTDDATYTRIRKLSDKERIMEIAKMLSGEAVTEAAISNARELLKY